MNKTTIEGHAFMKRALQISLMGSPNVSPNPMVGAVIVAEGRIIGEGYHRIYGKAHAEVNAINSVKEGDRKLLKRASMFVTLEPCSHFGKTPPCANLLIDTGIPHVIIAAEDPFLKDYESGIEKMRKAGIKVEVGLLKEEALWINRRFFTAHTLKRPYVLLKWAQSSDRFLAGRDNGKTIFSTPFTSVLMHRERAVYDAIMVGTNTVLLDNPRLDCRLWPCRNQNERPLKITFNSNRIKDICKDFIKKENDELLRDFLHRLYHQFGITSLMVEGGTETLNSFISENLFDEIRTETSLKNLKTGVPAPYISQMHLKEYHSVTYQNNRISYFVKNY